jgi:zinc protease
VLNGSTRFDFTNYFQVVPAHTLETVLWAEADRMRGLDITQENLTNQQEVVKNEVRVNVLNQPYGGFPWLDLPQYANTNWYNAHNFYGDLEDLDAATLEDVQSSSTPTTRRTTPCWWSSATSTGAGAGVGARVLRRHPLRSRSRAARHLRAAAGGGRSASRSVDPLATGRRWRSPTTSRARNTPEYYAMGLLDQILAQGRDSRLYQALVQRSWPWARPGARQPHLAPPSRQAPGARHPRPFAVPPARDFTLANGLRVTFVQYGRFPRRPFGW